METPESAEISKKDREKIIEVLLSQERVLTLLYDKTFPPKNARAEGLLLGEEERGMGGQTEFEEEIEKATGEAEMTESPTE